jgi:two-component system, chemotaxis family, chemotaxis protein CheY
MRTLVVEDDFISRRLLLRMLAPYGDCDVAVDGTEAVEAFKLSFAEGCPYDLVCLDIMLPASDGQDVLRDIRAFEEQSRATERAKVIMTSSLGDTRNVMTAFMHECDGYLVKPFEQKKLLEQVRALGLLDLVE